MPHHPRLLRLILLAACVLCALLSAGPVRAQDATTLTTAVPISATDALTAAYALTATTALTPSLQDDPLAGLRTPLAAAPVAEYATSFAEVECPFVTPWNQEIICGELEVPENRTNPESDGVSLFVVILKSFGRPEVDPILVLPDGPGAEGTSGRHLFYSQQDAPFRINRDIILVDPRGTGYSSPSLDCPEVKEALPGGASLVAAYHACFARLMDEGRDLGAYTSATQAADIADLAQELGIGTLNIYATGYGTRVAARLADRYPNVVRSMVLDGVLPIAANALLESPLNLYAAIQRVAQDCSVTPACNAAYPALEARLLEVIDRYNAAPAAMGYGSGNAILALIVARLAQGGSALPAFITALFDEDYATACALLPPSDGCSLPDPTLPALNPAVETLMDGSEAPAPWRALLPNADDPAGPAIETVSWLMRTLGDQTPALLFTHLDAMPLEEVIALLAEAPQTDATSLSEGFAASVYCAEDAPFFTRDDLRRVAARLPLQFGTLPLEHAALMQSICSFWQVPSIDASDTLIQPILAPVLIVNGTHDAQTPPAWARRAAATMEQSHVELFPGYGHSIQALGDDCLPAMLQLFYAHPASGERAACNDTIGLNFVLPGAELLP